MLIRIEKLAAKPLISLTPNEMKTLATAVGIGTVLTGMRLIGKAEEDQARGEEAAVLNAEFDRLKNEMARRTEIDRARKNTERHLKLVLMDRGIYTGEDDPGAAAYTAAAARRRPPEKLLPQVASER
jgi:predicted phosphoribosyltransferase